MAWDKWKKKFGLGEKKKEMADGLWMRCSKCGTTVYKKTVAEKLQVCPECKYHFEIDSSERLKLLLDEGSFQEYYADLTSQDPLQFEDSKKYPDRLAAAKKSTGLKDALVCGRGKVYGKNVVISVMDGRFIRASMGTVVGEKIARAAELATHEKLPYIVVCASGGARMQEGCISLMQMAKTSAALARHHDSGLLYISILTHPTTAGVMASFASQGDLILAEPQALIGFTGARVIASTIKAELPKGFQTAEYLMEHGFIDRIVQRKKMKDELAKILAYTGEDYLEGQIDKFKKAQRKDEGTAHRIRLPLEGEEGQAAEKASGDTSSLVDPGEETSMIDLEVLEPNDSPIYTPDSQEIRMATVDQVADDFHAQDTAKIELEKEDAGESKE